MEGLTFPNESRVEQLPEGFSVGRTLLKFQPRRGQDDWLEALGAGLEQLGDLSPAGIEPLVTSDASS